MAKILQADDLRVGQFVAILNGRRPEPYQAPEGEEGPSRAAVMLATSAMIPEPYAAIKGEPLRVVAMNLPFIMVRNLERRSTRFSIDTRLCELIKVDRQYALSPSARWWIPCTWRMR